MEEIKPFRLQSFEEEAQALVEEARARAAEIIRAAETERDRAFQEARRAGFEEGRREGREAGAREERARVASETAGLKDLLAVAARSIEEKREGLIAAAERDLVRLAVAVAGKIVKAEIAGGRNVAEAAVRRAIRLTASRQELRVLLHPEDLAAVDAQMPAFRREFADLGRVALEESPSVGRGGCVVLTREGGVDAGLATQLEEIERGLLA